MYRYPLLMSRRLMQIASQALCLIYPEVCQACCISMATPEEGFLCEVAKEALNLCCRPFARAAVVHPNRKAALSNGSAWIVPDVPTLSSPPERPSMPHHLCWGSFINSSIKELCG